MTSRTSPSSLCLASIASTASTRSGSPAVFERDDAHAGLVEAQIEQRVVELAEGADGPGRAPAFASSSGVCGSAPSGARSVSVAVRRRVVELDDRHVAALGAERARASPGCASARAACCARPSRRGGASRRPRSPSCRAPRRRGPTRRARLPRTPSATVENDVGQIAPDLALVDQAREPAGAGEHAEQRRLGQADGARSVVRRARSRRTRRRARSRRPRRCPRARRALAMPRLGAHLLEVEARLVRELAEVDLEAVGAAAQHVDVGAGAEDAVLAAGEDERPSPRGARSAGAAARRPARCRRRGRTS